MRAGSGRRVMAIAALLTLSASGVPADPFGGSAHAAATAAPPCGTLAAAPCVNPGTTVPISVVPTLPADGAPVPVAAQPLTAPGVNVARSYPVTTASIAPVPLDPAVPPPAVEAEPPTIPTSDTPSPSSVPPAAPDPAEPAPPSRPTPTPQPPSSGATPAPTDGVLPAITVEGDQILRDGRPWWFLGYNSFVWSGDCGDADERMTAQDVDDWFASMRHDGHGAVRLFFFDGWDLARLDAAVRSARAHDVYLTITLDDAIGGCGESEKDAGWFGDPGERAGYQRHMTDLLERYRGETAIAWFEYLNEPSYEGGALRDFYDDMGEAADTVDPERLLSSGTVAPYWLDGEANFRDVHSSPGVDIASLHEYDMDEVESDHGPEVLANSAGKPVIVGEFGIEAGPHCGGFASRAERAAAKAAVYTNTAAGYVGAFMWAWQPGGGGCETGNLDADPTTQEVLRTHR